MVCRLCGAGGTTLISSTSGVVEYASLPSADGSPAKVQVLQVPDLYNKDKTGPVCAMQWSSDGYALAVGWEHGWAIWSVGGRCLAWGFGVEYEVDEDRCVFALKSIIYH